ncbi:hypothetical protein [Streptomyces sp. NPDC056387]|uniref:hypothetical protein n=1 Tax=Streptomyces sp. NPDC056387 TaxID=3345803 RepID=UPI0035D61496
MQRVAGEFPGDAASSCEDQLAYLAALADMEAVLRAGLLALVQHRLSPAAYEFTDHVPQAMQPAW